jgi:hypothetical protein
VPHYPHSCLGSAALTMITSNRGALAGTVQPGDTAPNRSAATTTHVVLNVSYEP